MTETTGADQRVDADLLAFEGLETVRQKGLWSTAARKLLRDPQFDAAALGILVMIAIASVPQAFAGIFGHGDPHACDLRFSQQGPEAGHPFGFDVQGCDLYANVIYGARPSLAIGLLSATGLAVVAIVFGLLAGYYGGVLDTTISRLTDVFLGFPFLVAAIVILTSFHHRTVWTITMVIILFAWPAWTRVMRSGVLGVVNLEYVAAARALGASDLRILVRHILPNAIAPLVVLATLGVGSLIVAESSLTYLGVGLQLPAISWGLQLSTAQTYFSTHPHLLIFPALFLSVTVLSFVLAGDAVREALDPRQL